MAETKTIIVNPKVESEETIFPTLGLSNFEKQMKAFNSYSALNKFRDERGISPAFNYDTLGAYTAGNLFDLKNYGTSKFSVDFAGKITCVGLAAGSQKITGVLDPTANQDAATKKYVDDNTGLWEVDGTETQLKTADEIDMRSKKIINLTDPTANQDGATKKYVDDNAYTPPSASDDMLVASADIERDETTEIYTKKKEIKIGKTGTYRIKWQMKMFDTDRHGNSRVYKNGVAYGTEKVTYVTAYNDYSESSLSFTAGDLIQLYTKTIDEGLGGSSLLIQNFRIYATDFDIANVITD